MKLLINSMVGFLWAKDVWMEANKKDAVKKRRDLEEGKCLVIVLAVVNLVVRNELVFVREGSSGKEGIEL